MRFCLLTTFFPPQHFGGDAVLVAHLANALAAAGHEVQVVHCRDSFGLLQGDVPESPFPLDPRVRVHSLDSFWGPLSPVLTYFSGMPLLKAGPLGEILAQDFDVVHWHNISLVGGPGALRLGKGVRLCTLHDYWFICPTSILFKYDREVCTKKDCIRCTLVHRRLPAPWRAGGLLRRSIKYVDRFLAPSRLLQEHYRNSGLGIDPTVLPNFVPALPRARPARRDAYYLFVGRLVRAKGLQTILPLFVKTGRPLVIAGAGEFAAELRRLAAGSRRIEFLGRVPFDQLPPLYAGARATLAPSICHENFGLTVLESLQQGTPVITSDFGTLPELVARTGGGLVFRNEKELAEILNRLDADPDSARALGEQGASRLEDFTPEAHLTRYFEIIEEEKRRQR